MGKQKEHNTKSDIKKNGFEKGRRIEIQCGVKIKKLLDWDVSLVASVGTYKK